MSNVDTGSISGFTDGAVPAHLKAGGGLNSATRAVMQSKSHIDHTPPSAPTSSFSDGFPSFFNDNSGAGTGAESIYEFVTNPGLWFRPIMH